MEMIYERDLVLYRRDSKKSLKGVADRIWHQSVTYRVYAAFVKVTSAILYFTAKTALVVARIAAFIGLTPVIMFFSQKAKQITLLLAISMSTVELINVVVA